MYASPVAQIEPRSAAGRNAASMHSQPRGVGNQTLLRRLPRPDPVQQQAPTGRLQAKLTVGAVDDPMEQQADRIAEQVMRMPDADARLTPAPLQVHRKCAACEEEERLQAKPATNLAAGEAPASVHGVISSPGQALDTPTRSFFEPRFGRDMSAVRIHTDPPAAATARAIGAQAYTVGSHIAFAQDYYQPHSPAGRQLIAHELAHVMQQSGLVQREPDDAPAAAPAADPAAPTAGSPAPATAPAATAACAPIGAAAQAACSKDKPLVMDETTGRAVVWAGWRNKCLPQLTETQQAEVQKVEAERVKALDLTLSTLQRVQKAILMGLKRYPGDPSWDGDKTFFRSTAYMATFWYDSTKSLYFDYFNNPEDKTRYDNLDATGAVLSRNLSFRVFPGRYLCDSTLDEGTGAIGSTDGIIIPPDWISKPMGYKILTLTHEYFHVMIRPLIDDYPAFRRGNICKFSEAINEPNCLSAMVAWTYTGTDEQRKARGMVPCTPGGFPPP
jgi:Domain of unknown function (DUF4157)